MRNNQKPKPLSKSEKILKYCQLLGIETFADLQRFKKEEQKQGETLLKALERYFEEIANN